jgi:hypothetical protein
MVLTVLLTMLILCGRITFLTGNMDCHVSGKWLTHFHNSVPGMRPANNLTVLLKDVGAERCTPISRAHTHTHTHTHTLLHCQAFSVLGLD